LRLLHAPAEHAEGGPDGGGRVEGGGEEEEAEQDEGCEHHQQHQPGDDDRDDVLRAQVELLQLLRRLLLLLRADDHLLRLEQARRAEDDIHARAREQAEEGDRPGRLEDAGEDEPEERGRVADQRLRLARVRTREERRAGQAMMLKQYIADTTHVTMRSSLAGRRTCGEMWGGVGRRGEI